MNLSILLLSFVIPIIGFIFESYPRFINKKFGVDIWTHLLYLKEYHRQGGIPKKIKNGFLVEGEYDYPPMFILILSRFPFHLVKKYEFIFSPFFDSIHIIIIFYFSLYLSGSLFVAILTQIIYMITPIVVLENSSATPRSLGYTLFTLYFLSILFFLNTENPIYLPIAVIFGGLIFLTHRFTTQGALFISLFFSLTFQSAVFIAVYLLSFVTAVIFSKGFYFKVLQGHIGNLIFWKEVIAYRFAHQIYGNVKQKKSSDFILTIYNQFLKFPPFVLLVTNPWTLPAAYYFYVINSVDVTTKYLTLLVIFTYFLSLLVIWIPSVRFLGEGQRYLELSSFASSYLSAAFFVRLMKTNFSEISIVIYSVIGLLCVITIVVIQRKAIILDKMRTLNSDMEGMFNYLKDMKKKPRLLVIPHQMTTNTIYHTDCPVFVNADYKSSLMIKDVYPYMQKSINKIMKEKTLDMILLNTDYAPLTSLRLKGYKIKKKFGSILLLSK